MSRALDLVRIVGPLARVAIVARAGKLIAQAVQLGGAPDVTALTLACPRGRDGTLYLTHVPAPYARELAQRVGVRRVVLAPHLVLDRAVRERWATLGLEHASNEVAA